MKRFGVDLFNLFRPATTPPPEKITTFAQLQKEVGAWSRENFGDQSEVMPLLGVFEELGELADAANCDDEEDAIADACIFLCDFLEKDGGVMPDDAPELVMVADECLSLMQAAGRLSRAVLKRKQGIRGYDDPEVYNEERDAAVLKILQLLAYRAGSFSLMRGLTIATWNKVVAKRNWKANPEGGV